MFKSVKACWEERVWNDVLFHHKMVARNNTMLQNTTQETVEINKIAYLNVLQAIQIRPNSYIV